MDDLEHEFLRRVWFPLARVADLRDRMATGEILGVKLVAIKTASGFTVADATCPHRGMNLQLGRVIRDALECPYHGWLWAADTGRCVNIPSLVPGSPIPNVGLSTYRCDIAYGLIWTCLAEPFLSRPELPAFVDGSWRVEPGDTRYVRCGLRQLTENFCDRAHFPFVHRATLGNLGKVVEPYEVVDDGRELSLAAVQPQLSDAGDRLEQHEVLYRTVMPMFASALVSSPSGGQRLTVQMAVPIDAQGGRVAQFWLVGIDESTDRAGVRMVDVLELEGQIFEEDRRIVENQHPPEAPLDLSSQKHTRADRFSIVYRRAYARLIGECEREFPAGAAADRGSVSSSTERESRLRGPHGAHGVDRRHAQNAQEPWPT